MEYESKGRKEV